MQLQYFCQSDNYSHITFEITTFLKLALEFASLVIILSMCEMLSSNCVSVDQNFVWYPQERLRKQYCQPFHVSNMSVIKGNTPSNKSPVIMGISCLCFMAMCHCIFSNEWHEMMILGQTCSYRCSGVINTRVSVAAGLTLTLWTSSFPVDVDKIISNQMNIHA